MREHWAKWLPLRMADYLLMLSEENRMTNPINAVIAILAGMLLFALIVDLIYYGI